MDILLHTCCGPCLLMPYRELAGAGHRVRAYYSDSNIHPYSEYLRRLGAARDYCGSTGIEMWEENYDLSAYFEAVSADMFKPGRCHKCYELRLGATARKAVDKGIGVISTTLLVSPYQYHDDIRAVGESAAAEHGLVFHYADYRPLYRESVRLSRELGMYRQNYCGCVFSEHERILERKVRNGETVKR